MRCSRLRARIAWWCIQAGFRRWGRWRRVGGWGYEDRCLPSLLMNFGTWLYDYDIETA